MDQLFIFGAKYLWILSILIALGYLIKSKERFPLLKVGLFSLPLTYILGLIGRSLYENPRPFAIGGYEPLIPHIADNGFPSDHVLLVAAIAAVITLYNRRMGLILWVIALFIATSRVYVGVHHTLDVAASITISILATWVVYFLSHKFKYNATTN